MIFLLLDVNRNIETTKEKLLIKKMFLKRKQDFKYPAFPTVINFQLLSIIKYVILLT